MNIKVTISITNDDVQAIFPGQELKIGDLALLEIELEEDSAASLEATVPLIMSCVIEKKFDLMDVT